MVTQFQIVSVEGIHTSNIWTKHFMVRDACIHISSTYIHMQLAIDKNRCHSSTQNTILILRRIGDSLCWI